MDFQNKVAMITVASVGIGRATSLLMAERGASLLLLDINEEALQLTCQELEAFGTPVVAQVCDVSREDAVKAAVAEGLSQLGRIDILINNAALWRSFSPFSAISTAEWQRYLDVNIMGVVHCTKAVLDAMLERGYGRIINVASVAGVYGNADMVHYSATKGAVIAMTKALAKETTPKGVLVNAVSPGSVSSSEDRNIDACTPSELSFLGRTGTDRENAELICFLASDAASYISGQNIQIDGCRRKQ